MLSGCPLTPEALGDRWSLIVIRNLVVTGCRRRPLAVQEALVAAVQPRC